MALPKQFARRAYNRLTRPSFFNRKSTVSLLGKRFSIPIKGRMAADPSGEPWMLELMSKFLSERKGAFIDVGVNLGQTLLKLRSIDPGREYVGFEPNPSCVAYVEELIRTETKLQGATIIPAGLSDRSGILPLYLKEASSHDSGASIVDGFRPTHTAMKLVPVFTWDDLPEEVLPKDIALIKVDVEGAELEVIQSIKNLLKITRAPIIMEILPTYSIENHARLSRQTRLLSILKDELNYSAFRICFGRSGKLDGLTPIDDIEIHSRLDLCNYVFSPSEKPLPPGL